MKVNNLAGRQIVVPKKVEIDENQQLLKAMKQIADKYQCQRCGTSSSSFLPGKTAYCRACIGLGRITSKSYLLRENGNLKFPKRSFLTWSGRLTKDQRHVSNKMCQSISDRRNHLVHAVTGAGKTEMMFRVIDQVLKSGGRICIATPRIDVVNELYPRFCEAFDELAIGKYHGQEYQEPKFEQLTICTTHQLLKFYHAFDLIVIDEVDAFPFVNSPMLAYGAQNALKKNGNYIYLTATPTNEQMRQVQLGLINYSLLKHRFHGGKLPVPKEILLLKPTRNNKDQLHQKILRHLQKLAELNKPVMIFIPKIIELPTYYKILSEKFPRKKIATVYAGDPKRIEKIQRFRESEIDFLLTTTILERGVTIKHVQVLVIDADDRIYTTASLVQIAGRVGRLKSDPSGNIIFYYHQYTTEIKNACKQIKRMNDD